MIEYSAEKYAAVLNDLDLIDDLIDEFEEVGFIDSRKLAALLNIPHQDILIVFTSYRDQLERLADICCRLVPIKEILHNKSSPVRFLEISLDQVFFVLPLLKSGKERSLMKLRMMKTIDAYRVTSFEVRQLELLTA